MRHTFLPLIAGVLVTAGLAQEAAKPDAPKPETPKAETAKPAAREMPADVQALFDARRITDPQKKIEALEKVIADHPKSTTVDQARSEILSTLIKASPDNRQAIQTQAQKMVDAVQPADRARVMNTVAVRLLDSGILLEDAERFASQSIKLLDEKAYVAGLKKSAAERKQKPPSDGELSWRFRQMKGGYFAALGRIHVKQGNDRKGEKALKRAWKLNSNQGNVALVLAELLDKKGKTSQALDYFITARLVGGSTTAESARKIEAAYRKTHRDSVDGLEELLDAHYRKKFPPMVHPDAYRPTASRSSRIVLAEVFTGSGCPPCVSADLAFDAGLERYTRQELAVIMYHLHIPRPDPMTTEDTQSRASYYATNGVPTYIIDGERDSGGGPREYTPVTWDKVKSKIDKRLEAPAVAEIALDAVELGGKVNVRAEARNLQPDGKDLRMHVVLVEESLRYSGENGIRFHAMVARSIGGPKREGFEIDATKPAVEHTFELAGISAESKKHLDDYEVNGRHGKITFLNKTHEADPTRLGVVAFVQDHKTQSILQSRYLRLGPAKVSQAR